MFVLLTNDNKYFEENFFGSVLLSKSIKNAMVFNDKKIALKFKKMLFETEKIIVSVNTFIQ